MHKSSTPMQLHKFCKHHLEYNTSLPFIDLFEDDAEDVPHLIDGLGGSKMMHRDNIMVLQGKKKQGKSTAAMCFVMALLAGEFNGLKAHEDGCTVLWIDTEMGTRETRKRFRHVLQVLGMHDKTACERLKAISIKTIPKANNKRLDAVQMAVKEVYPDFVVLDGIADLVKDFNKPEECFDALEQLGEIAERTHIALLTLIHENRQDGNAKGHAGAATDQKAYELYSVKKDNGTSKVEYLDGRGEPCEGFSFTFGENGVPQPCQSLIDNERAECWQTWSAIFNELGNTPGGYTNKALKDAYKSNANCKDRTAQSYITKALDYGVLTKSGEGKNTRYNLCFADVQLQDDDDLL